MDSRVGLPRGEQTNKRLGMGMANAPSNIRCSCSTSSATWRCALPRGMAHSACRRENVLKPIVTRFKGHLLQIYFARIAVSRERLALRL
jgi:hypothetical protein